MNNLLRKLSSPRTDDSGDTNSPRSEEPNSPKNQLSSVYISEMENLIRSSMKTRLTVAYLPVRENANEELIRTALKIVPLTSVSLVGGGNKFLVSWPKL